MPLPPGLSFDKPTSGLPEGLSFAPPSGGDDMSPSSSLPPGLSATPPDFSDVTGGSSVAAQQPGLGDQLKQSFVNAGQNIKKYLWDQPTEVLDRPLRPIRESLQQGGITGEMLPDIAANTARTFGVNPQTAGGVAEGLEREVAPSLATGQNVAMAGAMAASPVAAAGLLANFGREGAQQAIESTQAPPNETPSEKGHRIARGVGGGLMAVLPLVHAAADGLRNGPEAIDVSPLEIQAAADQLAREGGAGPEARGGGEAGGAGEAVPAGEAPGGAEGNPREAGAGAEAEAGAVPADSTPAQSVRGGGGAPVGPEGATAGPADAEAADVLGAGGGSVGAARAKYSEREIKDIVKRAADAGATDKELLDLIGTLRGQSAMDNASRVMSRAIPEKPSTASQAVREVREQLSPVQVDEASRVFGGHLKEQNAIQALENQRFTKAMAPVFELRKGKLVREPGGLVALDRLTPEQQNDFFDRAEQGLPQANPQLDAIAQTLRQYQDAQTQALVQGGHLEDVIQNYMPHQYENEPLGLKLFSQRQSSIPNWQKERTYPLRSEAQAAGLTPKYPNPVEDVLKSYGRKSDYLATATAIKKGIADGVIQVWDKNTSPTPGADLVELDPKFVKMAGSALEEGQTLAAPRSVAVLLERNSQPGLYGSAAFRTARNVAGGLNTAQLLGPFHAATSAFNSFYSRMGLGITEVLRAAVEPGIEGRLGELGRGVKDIAVSPLAPILDGINGYKARKAALEGSGLSPVDQELVAGGHRIDMSEDYTMGAWMAFRRALAQDKNLQAAGLFPAAILEKTMYPIMQVLVPSLKTGGYLEAATAELKRLGPDAPEAAKRQALGRISDAMDDRFGQLVYDNGFWNKTARNVAQLLMRSPGWVAGSLRAGLGGVKDVATAPIRAYRAVKGTASPTQDPVITQRMGYLAAQAVGPMLIGSLYGYLKGGNDNKQKYLDYVAPKTGGKNKSGTPERYVPAGYTKEGYAWAHDPFATAMSKRNPMLSLAQDLSAGKDFMGSPFRDPTDPFYKRAADTGIYAAEQLAPIFSRGTLLPDPNINPRSNIGLLERMVGAPAPAYMASEEKLDKQAHSRFLKRQQKRTSQ